MRIAAIADVHYAGGPLEACGERRTAIADILLTRAIRRINRFIKPDLTIFLGDMLADADGPNAREEHERLAAIIEKLESPWIIVPGNHDGDLDSFYRIYRHSLPKGDCSGVDDQDLSLTPSFARRGQTQDVNGVRIVTFLDPEAPGYNAYRRKEDIARMDAARRGFDGPIVSVQHVPLFLPGTCESPYTYENLAGVWDVFERNRFTLALSGHWHRGDDFVSRGAGRAVIVPALCEGRFPFMEIAIDGDDVTTRRHELALPPGLNLVDYHVHTPFAYCSENMDYAMTLALAREFGLAGLAFTEHSGQLYFDADTFWGARFLTNGIDTSAGRADRMADYFAQTEAQIENQKSKIINHKCLGLEIDCDDSGNPVVRREDWDRLQVRVGSIHWLRELRKPSPDLHAAADEMLGRLERFAASGIDVLAHPLRVFRAYPDLPPKLIPGIMEILAKNNVAAEINFHVQTTSAEFLQSCLHHGVKIALGSDSHNLCEIGDFWPHLELLRECGIGAHGLADALADPPLLLGGG